MCTVSHPFRCTPGDIPQARLRAVRGYGFVPQQSFRLVACDPSAGREAAVCGARDAGARRDPLPAGPLRSHSLQGLDHLRLVAIGLQRTQVHGLGIEPSPGILQQAPQ